MIDINKRYRITFMTTYPEFHKSKSPDEGKKDSPSQLTKAIIKTLEEPKTELHCQFNPTQIKFSKTTQWNSKTDKAGGKGNKARGRAQTQCADIRVSRRKCSDPVDGLVV